MTVPVANTNLNDSFNTWRLNTNYISTIVSNNVVTVSRAGGSAARGGAVKGDGHVSGTFSSTVLRTDTLKSGNTTVLGSDLTIASNTIIGGSGTDTHTLTVHANTIFNANVDFATTGTDRVNMGDVSRLIIGGGSQGKFLRLATQADNPEFKSLTLRDITDMSSNSAHLILSGANSTFSTNKNSPKLIFAGGESTADKVEVFLSADATAGDSDLYLKLVDDAGDSKLVIADSANAVMATIDSDGSMILEKDFHAKGNAEVDGTFKADGTSSLVDITTKAITANGAVIAKTTLEVAGKAHLKGSAESLEVDGTSKFSGVVDIDAGVDVDTGNATFDVNTGTAKAVFSSSDVSSQFVIENVTDSADSAPDLALRRSTATPLDGDSLGDVVFQGHSVKGDGALSTNDVSYARIQAVSKDSGGIVDDGDNSDGLWEGKLVIDVNKHGSTSNHVLEMTPDDISAKKIFYTEAAAHLKGDLSVAGASALNAVTTKAITANSAIDAKSTLNVDGASTLNELTTTTLTANGAVNFETTLNVDGASALNAVTAKAITANSAIHGKTTLNVDGASALNATTTKALTANSAIHGKTSLNVDGASALNAVTTKALTANSAIDAKSTLNVDGASTLNELTTTTLTANGAIDAKSTLNVDGNTTLNDVTAVDLSANGNAIILGTAGIKGAVTLETTFGVKGAVILETTLSVKGNLTVDGGNLSVKGTTDLDDTLNVDKAATFGTTVDVAGNSHLKGNVRFDGELTSDGTNVFGTNGKLHANNTISDDTILNSMIQNDHVEFQADSGSNISAPLGSLVDFAGGTGISTAIAGTAETANTITITAATATDSVLGVASFDTNDFDVSSGAVTLGDSASGAVIAIAGTANSVSVSRTNGTVTVDLPNDVTFGPTGAVGDTTIAGKVRVHNPFFANNAITLGDKPLDGDGNLITDQGVLSTMHTNGGISTMNVYANTIFHDQVSIPGGIQTTSSSVLSSIEVLGVSDLKGNVDLGASTDQTVSVNGKIDTNIIPSTMTEDIGSATAQFNQAYFKGVTTKGDIAAEKGAFSSSLSVGGALTVTGDLTVSGTTTSINTATMNIADNMFKLNSDFDSETEPTENAGLAINRGSSANVEFRWNETDEDWQLTKDGTNFYDILTSHGDSIGGLTDLKGNVAGSDYILIYDSTDTGTLKRATITDAALKGVKGAVGPQGVDGDKGNSVIVQKIYIRGASAPSAPTDISSTFDFATLAFSNVPTGWSAAVVGVDASNPTHSLYVSTTTYTAVGTGTSATGTVTWSTPVELAGTGLKGEVGPQGEVGLQGLQGVVGPQGEKGEVGLQGPQGLQGVDGPQGDKGNTGATNTTTGLISTTNYVQAGRAIGSVALASDDGGGNANITFNHMAQTPDITGNVGRITVNVDGTNDASMSFSLAENKTSGSSYSLLAADKLLTLSTDNGVRVNTDFVVEKEHSVLSHVNSESAQVELINNKGEWTGSPTDLKGEVGAQGAQGVVGPQGVQGVKGNSVIVQKLYKRAASATKPTDTASTYDFSTNVIGGLSTLNTAGWYTAPPTVDAGFNPLWVIVGTYSAVGTGTDTGGTTWSNPTKLADAGQKGEVGAQGIQGVDGDKGNSVIVFKLYQRAASATAITDDSSSAYNFATGVLSNIPSGWSITPVEVDASNPAHPLFVTTTTYSAVGTGADTGGTTWSTPAKLVGSGQKGEVGAQGVVGPQGAQGADGNFGGASFNYVFKTQQSDSDPGNGNIRLNAAITANVDRMYIDNIDSANGTTRDFLTTIDDSTSPTKGHFRISNRLDASDYAIFSISGIAVSDSGYIKVLCAFVSGTATGGAESSAFSADEDVIVTFARTGDVGATGAQGDVGPQGDEGVVGPQGDEGGVGLQGPQGLQGVDGPQGDKGAVASVITTNSLTGTTKAVFATLSASKVLTIGIGVDQRRTGYSSNQSIYSGGTVTYDEYNNQDSTITQFVGSINGALLKKEEDGNVNFYIKDDIVAFASSLSDARYKENITKIEGALDKVDQLNGYTFNYISNGKASAGVLAQEVEEILPSAVTERETSLDSNIEGAYKTVAYDQLSSLFIESIKELRKENKELRQMIEELGNK